MIEELREKCAVGFIRWRTAPPVEAPFRLLLLMEKQHNRGQDGGGIVIIDHEARPGKDYIFQAKSISERPIADLFSQVSNNSKHPAIRGKIMVGHLRYGTYGGYSTETIQPIVIPGLKRHETLVLGGNFNLTNIRDLMKRLIDKEIHPPFTTDTQIIALGISANLHQGTNIIDALREEATHWDGGWAFTGATGDGYTFIFRDPQGIRPAFFVITDSFIAGASERPALITALGVPLDQIKEVPPGYALIVDPDGNIEMEEILPSQKYAGCSFERIYFSRGSDPDIYEERLLLGKELAKPVLNAIDWDVHNAWFTYVPNTAETAFYGLIKEAEELVFRRWLETEKVSSPAKAFTQYMSQFRVRVAKLLYKDQKMRTFITREEARSDLVAHVYDVTYGIIDEGDTIVVIDDSIVRGTTLKNTLLRLLNRLNPGHIVMVSSAPQIRYPDFYGIDMSRLSELIAFKAAIELLKERNLEHIIEDVSQQCLDMENKPDNEIYNAVKQIYKPFSAQEISDKIAELVKPPEMTAR
ncbi:MAG: amidophosphoribosyltransferase, partial [Chlorobi bacterium]|nr:amidophosphoribosyltransferase [Chlorobiota bacterium]